MARHWSRLLADAINPVLDGSPFQKGQTGEPPTDDFPGPAPHPGASVIWCGDYDEVIAAYPHLATPGVEPEENWCFDLTVEIDDEGRLSEVRLELANLPEVFEAIGRADEASASAALLGRPAEETVSELAALLARLFSADFSTARTST